MRPGRWAMPHEAPGGSKGDPVSSFVALEVEGVLHVILPSGKVFFMRRPLTEYDDATGRYRLTAGEWLELAPVPGTPAHRERDRGGGRDPDPHHAVADGDGRAGRRWCSWSQSMSGAEDARLPQLLTADAVAEVTGMSKPRIYELARIGAMPSVRLGRTVRFSAEALLAWVEAGGTRETSGGAQDALRVLGEGQ